MLARTLVIYGFVVFTLVFAGGIVTQAAYIADSMNSHMQTTQP